MSLKFDGSTYLSNIDMSSVLDSSQVLIHFWIKPSNVDVSTTYVFDSNNGEGNYVRFTTSTGRIDLVLKDNVGVEVVRLFALILFEDYNDWTCVDFIVDQSAVVAKVFIRLKEDRSEVPLLVPIKHNYPVCAVGAKHDGQEKLTQNTSIDQFYYSSKFITSDYLTPEGNLTIKYMADFYEFDNDKEVYLQKDSLRGVNIANDLSINVSGPPVPELLFEGFWEEFDINKGSLSDPLLVGTLADEEDKTNVINE